MKIDQHGYEKAIAEDVEFKLEKLGYRRNESYPDSSIFYKGRMGLCLSLIHI